MNRTEVPRFRKDREVARGACTRERLVDVKLMGIQGWLTHARIGTSQQRRPPGGSSQVAGGSGLEQPGSQPHCRGESPTKK